jgi:flagellar hook assembly protein FlgD
MSVAGVTNVSNSSTTQTGKSSSIVSKDDFLKILIAQIKYQDPLDPLKPDQFLSQLSQMTQVEQLQNISSTLKQMSENSASANMTQWLSAIGKKMSVDGQVLSNGDEVFLTPQGDYDEVLLTLMDATTGSTKEVRFSKGEALVYRHESDQAAVFGAVALKNNKIVSCTPKLYRKIASVQLVDSQPVMAAANGDSYSVSQIKQIKE